MKKSFLSYLGGKSQLSRQIIPLIPDHHCYCEVFAGAAWVFFKKPDLNDAPEVREILKDFTIKPVNLTYSVCSKEKKSALSRNSPTIYLGLLQNG